MSEEALTEKITEAKDFLEEEKDNLEKVKWLIKMRWVAMAFEALTPPFMNFILKFVPITTGNFFSGQIYLPVIPFLAVATWVGIRNIIFVLWVKNIEKRKILRFSGRELRIFANLQVILDLIDVTVMVYFTGGLISPCILFYFFHMATACTLLSRRESYFHATLTAFHFIPMLFLVYFGFLPYINLIKAWQNLYLYRNTDFVLVISLVLLWSLYGLVYLHSFLTQKLAQTQEVLRAKAIELLAFYNTSKMISSTLEIDKVIHLVMDKFSKTYKIKVYSFMLYDTEKEELHIKAVKNLDKDVVENLRFAIGEGIPGKALKLRKTLTIQNKIKEDKNLYYGYFNSDISNFICVPMIVRDNLIGVLNVHKDLSQKYSEMEMDLLHTIANNVAVSILNNQLYDRVKELSIKDGLTNIYNHRYFQDKLDEEIVRADRYNHYLSLIILDIDYFKRFNDSYGHIEGDHILVEIAKILTKATRKSDTLARYGGEEFVIIMPETNEKDSLRIAERIRKIIELYPFSSTMSGDKHHLTVSLGVATFPVDSEDKKDLINEADKSLYLAKEKGRNLVISAHSI